MSGGSYDYVYGRLNRFADDLRLDGDCYCASPAERKAFREHVLLVARAMRAIEWNDSGDGDKAEATLIAQCLKGGPS